nr:unnamed protein product [Digitaria exilis]
MAAAGAGGEAGDKRRAAARVVVFPLPFQGHITPALQLAGALHARGGLAVTILHTEFNAPDPTRHPGFSFVSVPDAVPETITGGRIAKILALNAAMETSGHVRAALASLMAEAEPRLACLIMDSTLTAAQKAAAGLGLPTLVLHTGGAACFRLFRSYDLLHDKGYLPATESNLHMPIKELPPLLVRDLFDPSKLPNKEIGQKILNLATETTTNSSGAILNTFEALEPHELAGGSGTSLVTKDRSCIEWLDAQEPGSVLYVSFGSVAPVTQDEFVEIAWGLVNSGKPFLWVVRRGLVIGVEKQELPEGFESAVEGRDQLATGRYVAETWKIGILLEGVLERGEIEKAIRKLMEGNEGAEIRERAKHLKEKVRMSLESSGSSQRAVDTCLTSLVHCKSATRLTNSASLTADLAFQHPICCPQPMADQAEHRRRRRGVVLFPLPFQGHITPMLQLAAILHSRGLDITVLHTDFNAPDPSRHHPDLAFVPIHESFPEEVTSPVADVARQLLALNAACEAPFRETLSSLLRGHHDVACAVVDGQCYAALRAASDLGLPALALRADSAATFLTLLAYPRLRDAGFVPVRGK